MTTCCIIKIVPVERQLLASKKQKEERKGIWNVPFISSFQFISMYFTFNYLPFICCSWWELQLWEKLWPPSLCGWGTGMGQGLCLRKRKWGREIAPRLKALAALAEASGSVPSFHMVAHNHACKIPGNLMLPSDLFRCQTPSTWYTYIGKDKHSHT